MAAQGAFGTDFYDSRFISSRIVVSKVRSTQQSTQRHNKMVKAAYIRRGETGDGGHAMMHHQHSHYGSHRQPHPAAAARAAPPCRPPTGSNRQATAERRVASPPADAGTLRLAVGTSVAHTAAPKNIENVNPRT